jgi:hypothetical protein
VEARGFALGSEVRSLEYRYNEGAPYFNEHHFPIRFRLADRDDAAGGEPQVAHLNADLLCPFAAERLCARLSRGQDNSGTNYLVASGR